jgi:ATP-dependent protease ClpP protease subunit
MAKRMWELKQAVEPNTLEMYIYGDVKGDSYDWWTDELIESETSANHFRQELAKYPNATTIKIYINSYGGRVFEGTAIYSQLRRHPAQKIIHVDGFACSVASVIAMAGDKVIMPRNTMMMIHNAWNIVYGNATQLRKAADDLDTIMEGNMQAYLEKSNGKISKEKLVELLNAETWLTAQQCFEYGFCDEVLGQEADLTEAKQMLQKVNKTLEQQLSYNRAIAAQFRELANNQPNPPEPQPKDPDPVPEPPKENKTVKLMAALFR